MSSVIVAEHFAWSDYPGLRAGRLSAGKPDLTKHPVGEVHRAASVDATQTLCGLPRALFPNDFPEYTVLGTRAAVCPTCQPD